MEASSNATSAGAASARDVWDREASAGAASAREVSDREAPDGAASARAASARAASAGAAELPTGRIGKRYAPVLYAVGREKVREYARAVGEVDPLYLDLEAARAAGYPDLVAPPMFAVVYAGAAIGAAMFDPELELDFSRLVHAGQEFRWDGLVVAGDEITTTTVVKDISERAGMRFYTFQTTSVNQRGETVCTGTWTNLIRPPA